MELTFSRKTIAAFAAVLVLILLVIGGYFAWKNGMINQWLSLNANPASPTGEPALKALSSIYAPNISADENAWESQICANMTSEGCKVFKGIYAPTIWNAAKVGTISNTTISFVGIAEKMKDGEQVWKLSTSNKAQPWLYAQVAQDPTSHKWLLVRLLFSQEAQARYGNQP